ncbi:Mce-associated membrane protein OS=Tsukamurella paurometabola (strain ATCC 8368 / DSM / CCUG 35730 / CIP 100753 / JCM 10117 / KCTC 9821 / NBRC 16120 / NCIMB 702349 / NCTC 13040) OX=521096 GN=Tpau_4178 PE=4 SV=1 [Tsukamurella paurometabola]|uniref:Mce-associated membrane protein n=1 Tax=Tsukamurella paurometabola (strain ATCC 8368 / DSM 20162 / CCUG 35730 / CIP 100753 / JCM 10117 / KCTC 9821 / NBRC 16120 / NCIMB 702349 / NCTC 13040) TaxID=521096 RepID=D5UP38_TSUPD|nr:hypothetical protein [Tsukamurella paurometabola]ADG80747.1 hypothetical protein Tpau_4178 [Tsukamurella paurometabola DSM 20162]SUP40811.1 Uncharacterised protein [Tsukamurella paurometabola]
MPNDDAPDDATTAEEPESAPVQSTPPDEAPRPSTAPPRNRTSRTSASLPAEPAVAAPGTTRAVALTLVITLLAVAAGVATFFALHYRGQVNDMEQAAADRARAEDIAGKYGVNAATVDFNDIAPWLQNLKSGVTDQVAKRVDGAAEVMRMVVVPVRLQSKGKLVGTKVSDEANGVYKVMVVIDTDATSLQAPQGTTTTTAYTITVDSNQNWLMSDIGNALSGGSGQGSGTSAPTGAPTPPAEAPAPNP